MILILISWFLKDIYPIFFKFLLPAEFKFGEVECFIRPLNPFSHKPLVQIVHRSARSHIDGGSDTLRGTGKTSADTHARLHIHGSGPDSEGAPCQVSLGSVCQDITFTPRHSNKHFLLPALAAWRDNLRKSISGQNKAKHIHTHSQNSWVNGWKSAENWYGREKCKM